jgi:drug/metabolite transporter (DMT)-like permease
MMLATLLPTGQLTLAVICAIAAAFSYALSNVLQQHEAEQLPAEGTMRLGFLGKLFRRPRWLAGMGVDVGGYVFEALALGIGTLVVVEPILATSLLLSLFLGAAINKRTISRTAWLAAFVFALGVTIFLVLVSPTKGVDIAPTRDWLIAGPLIIAFVLLCAMLAKNGGTNRAIFLGAGAGALFGVSALLTKAFVHYLSGGIFNWVLHWEPYALAVSSITGLLLAQSAFQTGALAAAISAEQLLQPLTGVALGIGLLGEHIDVSGQGEVLLLIIALVAMVWGVLALARAEQEVLDEGLPPIALADGS